MNKRTLAIISVSAGAGHVRAAQALEAAARLHYPGVEPVHIDVMDHVPALFRRIYAQSYIHVVTRHPALWGYLYDKTDEAPDGDTQLSKLRQAVERLNTMKLMKKLDAVKPDAVVCTHFLPAQLLSRLIGKGRFDKPVWVQVTDFDVHSLWVQPNMAGYFAASDEVAWRMADRGIEPGRIRVTGIPIMPAFGQRHEREACARELGIDPARTTLLMMSGGEGMSGIDKLAQRLLALGDDFQIVALAGRNAKLLESLKKIAAASQPPGRLIPMGFTTTIERIMSASDAAITKPGGLTTSECLALGLPMIVIWPIPGQEERNADYLLENGAALKACDPATLSFKVKRILADRQRLGRMREAARGLGRPGAARDVLAAVLGAAGGEPS